ncbi:MAG: hypothetical protein AAFQ39_15840 [Pseudomonadota bacterium]
MASSMFAPKILRVEVTEGIDLESGVYVTGDRITVGTGVGDTLRLGAGDITTEHLTLIRREDGKGWEYFTSDRGVTQIDKGNPRTGAVRAGMWFRLGNETRVDIKRVPMPPELAESAPGDEGKQEVPLAVALPIMALMLAAFGWYFMSLQSGGTSAATLRTQGWYLGTVDIEPSIDACLASGLDLSDPNNARAVPSNAPSADFRRYLATQDAETKADLIATVRRTIVDSHLLANEGRYGDAARGLRSLERVLPVGDGACPVLEAARTDFAIYELRAER